MARHRWTAVVVPVALAVLFLLPACTRTQSNTAHQRSPNAPSGIEGTSMIFPGGAVEPTLQPYPVSIAVHGGSGKVVAWIKPDASTGEFRVELPPAIYTLTWGSKGPSRVVRVTQGKFAHIEFVLNAF